MQAVRELLDEGVTQIALSSVFSIVRADMEERAYDLITRAHPDLSVTKSSDIGRLARENAAIINSALRPLAEKVVHSFELLSAELNLKCPVYFTKNDGTQRQN